MANPGEIWELKLYNSSPTTIQLLEQCDENLFWSYKHISGPEINAKFLNNSHFTSHEDLIILYGTENIIDYSMYSKLVGLDIINNKDIAKKTTKSRWQLIMEDL
jgi:hypothetical protein